MAGGKAPEATSFDNFDFGIEETGVGNAELLEGLYGGADTDPDDIEEIEDEEEETPKPKKKTAQAAPAKKTAVKRVVEEEEEEEEEEEDSLQDQFDDEEEEEEEIIIQKKEPAKKKKEEAAAADEEDADDSEEDEDNAGSPFSSISKELFRLGVFTPGEDDEELPEITSGEQFLEQFQIEKKKGAAEILENFLGRHGEDYREAFQAIFINGVNPKEYLQTYAQIESFKELELEGNESSQERVVREALKQQGFDVDDIDAEVERLKQYGDLETTSKRYHKILVKKEEAKLTELATKKAAEREQEERQERAYQASISKILTDKAKARNFDGLVVTPQQAQETFDYLSNKKYKTPSGELLTEFDREILELKRPENHELRVKLALLMRNKLDLSKIKRAAVSEESKGLFSELAHKKTKKSGSAKGSSKVSSWFGS